MQGLDVGHLEPLQGRRLHGVRRLLRRQHATLSCLLPPQNAGFERSASMAGVHAIQAVG